MQRKTFWSFAIAAVMLLTGWTFAQDFNKLSKEDHAAFQERFTKEIWPLMIRNGKDGCVGCHSGGIVSDLHLSKDPAKDFSMLLKEGFFVPNDPGSLAGRVESSDPRRRMPPKKLPGFTPDEIKVLKAFVADMDKKQKK